MNHLNDVINMRRSTGDEAASSAASDEEEDVTSLPLPHYIVFCTDSRVLENEPALRQLLSNRAGMTLIMLAPSMELLPKESRLNFKFIAASGIDRESSSPFTA